MRLPFTLILTCILFTACNDQKVPDVSDVKVPLIEQRFEKDFFSMDTVNINESILKMQAKYPEFMTFFMYNVLEVVPNEPTDTLSKFIKMFISQYQSVKDSSDKLFANFDIYTNELRSGLRFVKHYFPNYPMPKKIITFIGTPTGFGDAIAPDALYVGLQYHLGSNFPLYKTEMVLNKYPEYISRNFTPEYIAVNCMKIVVTDLYPEKEEDKPLVNQMVEKGKRLYLLSRFLPFTEEYKLIGYTEKQLKETYSNEALIWNFFVQNSLLNLADKNLIKSYISEGPKTQELGEGTPGNIGSFTGWQIVKKYMNENPKTTMKELMKTDAEVIFQKTKYKP